MKIFLEQDLPEIIHWLTAGKVGVLRTDTLYGLICKADNQVAVERIYSVKGREGNKSPIVLVASQQQLFDEPSELMKRFLETVWPGKISVVIPSDKAPSWVERGNSSVAYRLPDHSWLQEVLACAGPLIAPSANLQGKSSARTTQQAMSYFGDMVDFYVDGGEVIDNTPSQLLRVKSDGEIERLR